MIAFCSRSKARFGTPPPPIGKMAGLRRTNLHTKKFDEVQSEKKRDRLTALVAVLTWRNLPVEQENKLRAQGSPPPSTTLSSAQSSAQSKTALGGVSGDGQPHHAATPGSLHAPSPKIARTRTWKNTRNHACQLRHEHKSAPARCH